MKHFAIGLLSVFLSMLALSYGCSASAPPSATQVADTCIATVTMAPQTEKLSQQYGMTVPEFARQVCGLASVPISQAVALGYAGATVEAVR